MAINNNDRRIIIPCIECGFKLEFHIKDDVVVDKGGLIACNLPAAICSDCVDAILAKVPDPPGIIRLEGLSQEMVRALLESFTFLLPKSEALEFFASLFPKVELV